jgi:DNA-binding CsgD family transcriptional regulator
MVWTSISPCGQVNAAQVATLIEHIDDDRFDTVLLNLLGDIAPVAEVNGFALSESSQHPTPVGWCGSRAGTAARVDRYDRDFHRLDPTLRSLPRSTHGRGAMAQLLTAESVGNDQYRKTCFEDPSFSQKVSIAYGGDGEWTILNVYFGSPCSSSPAVQEVMAFGSLVAPFMKRRSESAFLARRAPSAEHADERVSRLLHKRFPTLTARERRVCALTMIGKSSGEIATTLGISAGTVLTYRRRAYERLGISSAASLVAQLL